MAWLFGADDREVKHDIKTVDWRKAQSKFKFAAAHVAPGASLFTRAMRFAAMARGGERGEKALVETRCERGADIMRDLRFPEAAAQAVRHLDEHWDGGGHPTGAKGTEIPIAARLAGLAQTVEVFLHELGVPGAIGVAELRRGTWFDPQLVDALVGLAEDTAFWHRLNTGDLHEQLSEIEPADTARVTDEDELDRVCEAFARVVDAKSPWTHKHSTGVAEIAVGIGGELGLPAIMLRDLRRAGLLHDLGKLGVSNMILDKPGRPTNEEYEQIKKHPDYSERILRRVNDFQRLADVAGAHHERLDGRGYHHRTDGDHLPTEARSIGGRGRVRSPHRGPPVPGRNAAGKGGQDHGRRCRHRVLRGLRRRPAPLARQNHRHEPGRGAAGSDRESRGERLTFGAPNVPDPPKGPGRSTLRPAKTDRVALRTAGRPPPPPRSGCPPAPSAASPARPPVPPTPARRPAIPPR